MLIIGFSLFLFMNLFYVLARVKKNFAIVDIAWPMGFMLLASLTYALYPQTPKSLILLLMVIAWGARLGFYLYGRNWGAPEDQRYTDLRQEWGKHVNLQAYVKIFMFQGLLMVIISLPALVGISSPARLTFVNFVGLGLWVTGILYESYADYYLSQFKKRPGPKPRLCLTGPWKLQRFPNYAGEILLWYGLYLFSFELTSWWTVLGPLTLNVLIYKVTGIPPLEKKYLSVTEYQAYAQKVPRLIPFTRP